MVSPAVDVGGNEVASGSLTDLKEVIANFN